MKKIASSVTLRAGVATALCLSFIIYLPLRVSCAGATAHAAVDVKSEWFAVLPYLYELPSPKTPCEGSLS